MECEFEAEVLEAVLQGRWPARTDAGLRAHVKSCEICSEVSAVATILSGHYEAINHPVPDAGQVWRSAQVRARNDAEKTAARPIVAVQAIALACIAGLLAACANFIAPWLQEARTFLPSASALFVEHGALLWMMAIVFLVLPAAVCAVVLRD